MYRTILIIFLVVATSGFGLKWHEARQDAEYWHEAFREAPTYDTARLQWELYNGHRVTLASGNWTINKPLHVLHNEVQLREQGDIQ